MAKVIETPQMCAIESAFLTKDFVKYLELGGFMCSRADNEGKEYVFQRENCELIVENFRFVFRFMGVRMVEHIIPFTLTRFAHLLAGLSLIDFNQDIINSLK